MKIKRLIKQKRMKLGETIETFGKRFEVDESIVSEWEEGVKEPPYQVIEFVLPDDEEMMEKSGKLLGVLHQAAMDAIKNKMEEVGQDFELAYWQIGIKTTLQELDTTFEKPLKTHVLETDKIL